MGNRKYSKEELATEIMRVYNENGRIRLSCKQWDSISSINSKTIMRHFDTWIAAWDSIGVPKNNIKQIYQIKEEIIIKVQKTYNSISKSVGMRGIIRKSGITIGTVNKYFGSVYNLQQMANITFEISVTKEDAVRDLKELFSKHSVLTKKLLRSEGKYPYFIYVSNCGADPEEMCEKLGLNIDRKTHISESELLENLMAVCDYLGRAPKTSELTKENNSRFSMSAYSRAFGGIQKALKAIGVKPTKQERKISPCPVCSYNCSNLLAHLKKEHPEELKEHNEYVVELYKNGASNRKISLKEDVWYTSSTSVSRVTKKYTTPEERELLRTQKIQNTLKDKHAAGELDWVNDINTNRNIQKSSRDEMSKTIKNSYATGDKVAWNKGLTKENSEILAQAADKTAQTMTELYDEGILERKYGANSSAWVENRSEVKSRYRLNASFSKTDRTKIKDRASYNCEFCGISQEELLDSGLVLECDHILSIKSGGINDWEMNGQALCYDCHKLKTSNADFINISEIHINSSLHKSLNSVVVYKGLPLLRKEVVGMDYSDKVDLTKQLFRFFKVYNFSKLIYSEVALNRDFTNLTDTKVVVDNGVITNQNSVGSKICRSFFPQTLNVSVDGAMTATECIENNELLFKAVNYLVMGAEYNITPSSLIRVIRSTRMAQFASVFKPVTAKAIYDHWVKDGDTVYDFSAGFGGRMLGLKSTGMNCKYIATEPNTKTYEGLLRLANRFDIDAEIHCMGSESFMPRDINFAFSSPPYFDYEIYCDEGTQSVAKFPEYRDWLSKYWRGTVKNIRLGLVDDGVFALNAGNDANDRMRKIYKDMNDVVRSEGFVEVDQWHMRSNSFGGKSKLEPINFYRQR